MNRMVIVVLGAVLATSLCYGQGSTSASAPAAVGHGAFPVKVVKTLDSSKLKEDDIVEVETAGGFKLPDGTLVPKGSKLEGRVVAAKARSKGDPESQLTLTFVKLNIANGKQLSIKGTVQEVFPALEEQMGPNMSTQSTSTPQAVTDTKATGVQGVHDLQLENGVLTSKGKNVKLGGGVRLIVRADIMG
jgi:hypothetical protein